MTRNPAESSPELLKYSVKLFLSVGQVCIDILHAFATRG